MSDDAIIGRLCEILRDNAAEERDWDAIGAGTTFESIGIDSLSILDLLYDVEQEFGVHLEGEDVIKIRTMGEFADLLQERGG